MNNRFDKVLIIGLGLIGTSYAIKLKELGFKVYAITRSKETIDYALENNIIDQGYTEVKKEFVEQFNFLIFSLYPKQFISWIKEYKTFLKKGALITDVTGVKGNIVYKIQEELKGLDVDFIPHHPMAGKEKSGIRNADPKMFVGANFIVTPLETNKPKNVCFIKELGLELGFKNVSELSVDEHDEMIAFLSQLTHAIAVSLMTSKDSTKLKDYTGDSFRDLTRIASINEEMWSELFLLNKEKLLKEMDSFLKEFDDLKDAIEREDIE